MAGNLAQHFRQALKRAKQSQGLQFGASEFQVAGHEGLTLGQTPFLDGRKHFVRPLKDEFRFGQPIQAAVVGVPQARVEDLAVCELRVQVMVTPLRRPLKMHENTCFDAPQGLLHPVIRGHAFQSLAAPSWTQIGGAQRAATGPEAFKPSFLPQRALQMPRGFGRRMAESVHAVTDKDFQSFIGNSGVVLVDFWAPWCGPCRRVGPVIEQLATEMPSVKFGKLNTDENQATAAQNGVMSIPTIMIYKNGQKVDQIVGAYPKEHFVAALKKHA